MAQSSSPRRPPARTSDIIGVVERALAKILGAERRPTRISAVRSIGARLRRDDVAERRAHDPLIRPRGASDHGGGAIGPIEGHQFGDDASSAWIDSGSRASRRSRRKRRAFRAPASAKRGRMCASAPATARPPAGSVRAERRRGGGEGRHARRDRSTARPRWSRRRSCSPIALQIDRSPECSRATSWPAARRLDAERDDRVEIERRGVDDLRARRAMVEQRLRAPASRHRGRPGSARSDRARAR